MVLKAVVKTFDLPYSGWSKLVRCWAQLVAEAHLVQCINRGRVSTVASSQLMKPITGLDKILLK